MYDYKGFFYFSKFFICNLLNCDGDDYNGQLDIFC